MSLPERLEKLRSQIVKQDLDCMIMAPSGDMNFFIGFSPHLCERFQALFVLKNKEFFYIANAIYREEMQAALPKGTPIYIWDDAAGWHEIIQKAFKEHNLDTAAIGINDTIRGVDLLDLQRLFDQCRFKHATNILESCRMIKTPEQVSCLKSAARYADQVMEEIKFFIKPGIMERDIKNQILKAFAEMGLDPSFEPIIASGTNNSIPHYNKDSRIVQEKDVIILDFGCRVSGFCSDTSRTYFVGKISSRETEIYTIVKQAFEAAADTAREGMTAGQVDKAARDIIDNAGYGAFFLNRTGHGIGMDVHEAPYIRGNNSQKLEKGMAFSIEPGIYIPGVVGMRIEDIFIINDQGKGESLNYSSKEITVL